MKLHQIYNKIHFNFTRKFITLFILIIGLASCGCATQYNRATNKEELILYSTKREVSLGKSLANQIEKIYEPEQDVQLQEEIDQIGQKLTSVCERRDITYHFVVLSNKEVNALALPGGYIYVNKGLLDITESEDEIAYALAHEIGHVVAKHSIKRYQGVFGYNLLRILIAASNQIELKRGADVVFGQMFLAYSRNDELLADRLAARYVQRAGYNPEAMLVFLEKLKKIEYKRPLRPINYLKTHPSITSRIRVVREEILGYTDFLGYINE